ncbi:MAG: hypothetical protein HFG44_01000 [Oscillospiraceae bacterium]|nr:hypothetical protein [Oscillospiraceae bacterium]
MREKLLTYIDCLFAGAPNTPQTAEIKTEILQNTLDRYDDLIAEGKTPEAAYSLAVSGIGDISEILSGGAAPNPRPAQAEPPENANFIRKLMTGIAVGLYILCVAPCIILQDEKGVVGMFGMIALATVLLCVRPAAVKVRRPAAGEIPAEQMSAEYRLKSSVNGLLFAICLAVYFIVSFWTGAWYITWVIFLMYKAVCGIVSALLDMRK